MGSDAIAQPVSRRCEGCGPACAAVGPGAWLRKGCLVPLPARGAGRRAPVEARPEARRSAARHRPAVPARFVHAGCALRPRLTCGISGHRPAPTTAMPPGRFAWPALSSGSAGRGRWPFRSPTRPRMAGMTWKERVAARRTAKPPWPAPGLGRAGRPHTRRYEGRRQAGAHAGRCQRDRACSGRTEARPCALQPADSSGGWQLTGDRAVRPQAAEPLARSRSPRSGASGPNRSALRTYATR